ncbi:MAG: SpoIID/LytB domain-containing protein [Clostridia bacterium]|nr:SpoIID/LytB domain-containing protein [Clostridia bacterium]
MILFVLFTFVTSFAMVNAQTLEAPEDIRIGLFYGSKAVDTLRLSSPGGIEIGTMSDGEFKYSYEVGKDEELIITKSDEDGAVYIKGFGEIGSYDEFPYFKSVEESNKCLIEINGTTYRGNVEIKRFSDSDMTVINHLSMQEYLYGVVPREIGGNSPIEAVKAQAIVARTYAAKNYGRRDGWGFDLYPTVDDQAYGGYEWENINSNRAVDETDGQVIVYDGELIGGYYFSTSGGYTENSENVWGGKLDYLKAVPDCYEPEIDGNTTWEVEFTASEIKNKLAKNGINVGEIIDLEPIEYTDAGRVLRLKIIGTDGETTLTKSNTRTYFGLKSQWYTINDIAPQAVKYEVDDLPIKNSSKEEEIEDDYQKEDVENVEENEKENEEDDYIAIKPEYSNDEEKVTIKDEPKEMKPLLKKIVDFISRNKVENEEIETKEVEYKAVRNNATFTFRGRGWGHAVGMSQNGAKGMAEEGFSCEEIITWYYSGVEVVG